MHGGHLQLDAFRGDVVEVRLELGRDVVGILVGHKTHRDFGVGLGGDDRLGAFTHVPSPNAVHIQSRTNAHALRGAEARFPFHSADVDALLVRVLAERRLGHGLALLGAQLLHVVVEPFDGDVLVLVLERRDHLAQNVDGVGCRTAVQAAVQVPVGAGDFHFHVAQTAESRGDGRHVVGNDARVAHQHHVGGQAFLVLAQKILQVDRAHLLFSFNHELDVARDLVGGHHGFKRFDVHEELAFVVAGATSEDGALGMQLRLLDHRLESRAVPQVDGVGRLHVVMSIHQHRRLGAVHQLLAVHHRVALGGHYFHVVCTCFSEVVCHDVRALQGVLRIGRIGRNAWDAQQLQQLLQHPFAMRVHVIFHVHAVKVQPRSAPTYLRGR